VSRLARDPSEYQKGGFNRESGLNLTNVMRNWPMLVNHSDLTGVKAPVENGKGPVGENMAMYQEADLERYGG
jgi:hypothetical protein